MGNLRVEALKSEVIKKVKAIDQQKEAKKEVVGSFNDTIKALKHEMDALLVELEEAQRAELADEADSILEANEEKGATVNS